MLTQEVMFYVNDCELIPVVEVDLLKLDDSTEDVQWRAVVSLTVADGQTKISGDEQYIDFELPVLNKRTGKRLYYREDPEEWARSLETLYHAPQLQATIVKDTNPPPSPPDVPREKVVVPEYSRTLR